MKLYLAVIKVFNILLMGVTKIREKGGSQCQIETSSTWVCNQGNIACCFELRQMMTNTKR